METQILNILSNISAGISKICGSILGKIAVVISFLCTIFFAIKGLLIITSIIVGIDFILGIIVTIHKKGIGHILSSRLRDSLIKWFFYLLFICLLFLVETQLVDGFYLTSKAAFAIISGVELWSIMANVLVIFPNFPVIRLFKKYLEKEISKKLDINENELINDLNEDNKI